MIIHFRLSTVKPSSCFHWGYSHLLNLGWDIHTCHGFSEACRCAKGSCTVLLCLGANLWWASTELWQVSAITSDWSLSHLAASLTERILVWLHCPQEGLPVIGAVCMQGIHKHLCLL